MDRFECIVILVVLVLWFIIIVLLGMEPEWRKRKNLRKKDAEQLSGNRTDGTKRLSENIYDDSKVVELANLCKMGDIAAMLDMAYFFKDCCEKPLRELLDAYELKPVEQNEEADMLIERCQYYKKESYIPYTMYTDQDSNSMSVWESDSLWKKGIIDMIRGKEDCKITFCREKSYFDFWYVDSYDPADEYGFGAEWEYITSFFIGYQWMMRRIFPESF